MGPCGSLMQSAFVSSALQGKVSLPPCTPFGSAVIPRRSWTLDDHVRKLFKNLSAFRRPILWHRVHFYGRPRGAATLLVNSIFLNCREQLVLGSNDCLVDRET